MKLRLAQVKMIKPNLTHKLLAKQAVQLWLGFIIFTWVKAPTVHVAIGNNTFDRQLRVLTVCLYACLGLVIIDGSHY